MKSVQLILATSAALDVVSGLAIDGGSRLPLLTNQNSSSSSSSSADTDVDDVATAGLLDPLKPSGFWKRHEFRTERSGKWLSVPLLSAGAYGIVTDCRSARDPEDGSRPDRIKCGVDAFLGIVGLYLTSGVFVSAYDWVAHKKEHLLFDKYTNFALAITGTMRNFMGSGGFLYRRPNAQTRRQLEHARRASETMTELLGFEVRHVGFWDGPRDDVISSLGRRGNGTAAAAADDSGAEKQRAPVFSARQGDLDLHFSHSRDLQGRLVTHVGFGPGLDPEAGHHPDTVVPRKRDDTAWYNGAYFDRGGLAGIGEERDIGGPVFDVHSEWQMRWLRDDIECHVMDWYYRDGIDQMIQPFWWEIWDFELGKTRAAGAIVPFEEDAERSELEFLTIEDGLKENAGCMISDW